MRGTRLEKPPRWGMALLAVLVVAAAGAVAFLVVREPARPGFDGSSSSAGSSSAQDTTAGATPSAPDSTEAAQAAVLAVYGDGYTAGNDEGGLGAAGWPALVAATTATTLELHAVSRAGYSVPGVSGQTYPELVVDEAAPAAAVTLVVGSRNDATADPARVGQDAAATYAAIRASAPTTQLVVVGPIWDDADVPAAVTAVGQAVRTAAEAAGAVYVDPLGDGWFAAPEGLIAGDGISPTDAGHAYLADQLAPLVQEALTAAEGTP